VVIATKLPLPLRTQFSYKVLPAICGISVTTTCAVAVVATSAVAAIMAASVAAGLPAHEGNARTRVGAILISGIFYRAQSFANGAALIDRRG